MTENISLLWIREIRLIIFCFKLNISNDVFKIYSSKFIDEDGEEKLISIIVDHAFSHLPKDC